MATEYEDDDELLEEEEQNAPGETSALAIKPGGDGMPIGNDLIAHIDASHITITEGGAREPILNDDAAAAVIWNDYIRAVNWLDNNSWLAEWQYIDYIYQSPNYDSEWRSQGNRTARITRFNVAKNKNTLSTQTRRGIFADTTFFLLEPRGKLAALPNAQQVVDAITALLTELSDRGELEYNMELFIDCMTLQGTAIAIPVWEETTILTRSRKRKTPPVEVAMPLGGTKTVNTQESDVWEVVTTEQRISLPYFEYRRLGTTIYDDGWRTPNRPDLSAIYRIDIDYVNMQDLQKLAKLDCYKNIPSEDKLLEFFTENQNGDAHVTSIVAQSMNEDSSTVMHAAGEYRRRSHNPTLGPMMKISYRTGERVQEMLVYQGRYLIIRNEEHWEGTHALGYSATWFNIENSGYGFGQGRMNAGDQRMDQGVLNQVLKMIAYPLNAPLMYNTANGNAPTQNMETELGTMWGIEVPSGGDIRKEVMWMEPPTIPAEVWKIYQLGKEGGEDVVGANAQTMSGQVSGQQGIGRTATGAQRLGAKADEGLATPIAHLEYVLERWLQFLWKMVLERMPISEIRSILSDKFGEAILDVIDMDFLMSGDARFNIKILAGQKMAARAAISQLIPFLLQLVQQPQLMEYMHQKGWTINFLAIEKLFMQVSELQGREDIIVPLSPAEMNNIQNNNPQAARQQLAIMLEKLRQQGKLTQISAEGMQQIQQALIEHTLSSLPKSDEHSHGQQQTQPNGQPAPLSNVGSSPLDRAEAINTRATDRDILTNGLNGVA